MTTFGCLLLSSFLKIHTPPQRTDYKTRKHDPCVGRPLLIPTPLPLNRITDLTLCSTVNRSDNSDTFCIFR